LGTSEGFAIHMGKRSTNREKEKKHKSFVKSKWKLEFVHAVAYTFFITVAFRPFLTTCMCFMNVSEEQLLS